jgi:hypothetical protein
MPTRRQNIITGKDAEQQSGLFGLYAWSSKIDLTKATRTMPSVLRVLGKFLSQARPDFACTSVQVNRTGSAPHVDKNNEGPSLICGLGNYVGGRLWVESAGGLVPSKLPQNFPRHSKYKPGNTYQGAFVDIENSFVKFDGNVLHHTEEFDGERWSLVFFTNARHRQAPEHVRSELRDALRIPS